jgi:hypothetical protein
LDLTLYVNGGGSRSACGAQDAQGQQHGHCLRFDDSEHVDSSDRNPQTS